MYRERFRVVLDTNVVFEGLTRKAGPCAIIVDAWFAERLQVFISDALAYEYVDVLSRKLTAERWQAIRTPLRTLMGMAEFVPIRYSWRPASPDPGDEMVIDCAMNANAAVISSNRVGFARAESDLGLAVLSPREFVDILHGQKR
ncbi:MAG: putative toxin-antitoxin system toxin component, PIN family [Rubricoccaceae bacterium]|nr:putative toxin-antitoxin system toxin component, PIN family [Rubricoccaceae bacterium]